MTIAIPTPEAATRCVAEFSTRPKYRLAEEALSLLFARWPTNENLAAVHLKVVALNSMYSTQIYDTYSVSKRIHEQNIDDALRSGDLTLVERMAPVSIRGKDRFNLSFASKYCSWHMPDMFAIFDSYVVDALWYFRRKYAFLSFHRKDLRSYEVFMGALDAFSDTFGLRGLSRKQLDQYLWVVGERLRA
jgi:hypothetical protein